MKNQIIIKSIYLFIIILFSYQNLWSQNPVNIIQSNKLEQIIINDTIFQKLSGDVIIEYTEFTIQCDTMLFDEYKENLIGWGNINVVNTELKCSSDAINIHKLDSTISFLNNTVIELDNLVIYSDNAKYSYNNNIYITTTMAHFIIHTQRLFYPFLYFMSSNFEFNQTLA